MKIKGPSRQMPVVLLTVDGSECELMFNPRHGKVSIVVTDPELIVDLVLQNPSLLY